MEINTYLDISDDLFKSSIVIKYIKDTNIEKDINQLIKKLKNNEIIHLEKINDNEFKNYFELLLKSSNNNNYYNNIFNKIFQLLT